MKKISLLLIITIILVCFVSCTNKIPITSDDNEIITNINNIAIVYFSATNNTKKVAQEIESITKGTLIEIIPINKYTKSDLDYNNSNSRANKEQNDPLIRPEILNTIDISNYDIIFVGYPIWWGKLPKIMYTFFDMYDFDNKIIIPFCTSGSSGIYTSVNEINNLEPNAIVNDGKRFSENAKKEDIDNWIKELDINTNMLDYTMNIKIGEQILEVELVKNTATKELLEKLKETDITLNLKDYGNFEKTGPLGFNLTKSDVYMNVDACDVVLYLGSNICIYYDVNSWDFTPIGKIKDVTKEELKKILGSGSITITLSIK